MARSSGRAFPAWIQRGLRAKRLHREPLHRAQGGPRTLTVPIVPGPPSKQRQMTRPESPSREGEEADPPPEAPSASSACAAPCFDRNAPSQPKQVPSAPSTRLSVSMGRAAALPTAPASNKPRRVISEPKLGVPLSTCRMRNKGSDRRSCFGVKGRLVKAKEGRAVCAIRHPPHDTLEDTDYDHTVTYTLMNQEFIMDTGRAKKQASQGSPG
jgi:hypothetical protein